MERSPTNSCQSIGAQSAHRARLIYLQRPLVDVGRKREQAVIQLDLPTRPAAGRFEQRTGLPAWYLLFVLFWIVIGFFAHFGLGLNDTFSDLEPGLFATIIQTLGWLYVSSIGLLLGWGWETGAKAKAFQRTVVLGVTPSRQQIVAMFPRTRLGAALVQLGFYSGDQDQHGLGASYVVELRGWALFRVLMLFFVPGTIIDVVGYWLLENLN